VTSMREKLSKRASELESWLSDNSKRPTFERRYLNLCSVCNQFDISHHLLDVAFNSFCQGKGASFSRKYLRRFARRVLSGDE